MHARPVQALASRRRLRPMSPSSPVWTVIGALLGRRGAVAVLRVARQGGLGEPLARRGGPGQDRRVRGSPGQRRVGDAGRDPAVADRPAGPGGPPAVRDRHVPARPARPGRRRQHRPADRWLPASLGVFGIAWIAILRSAYGATAVGAGSFAVDLIHPLADLLVLGVTMPARAQGRPPRDHAVSGPGCGHRRGFPGCPGAGFRRPPWQLAAAVLACGALPARRECGEPQHCQCRIAPPVMPGLDAGTAWASTAESAAEAVIGLVTAAVAALTTLIFAVATWGNSGPAPLIVCCALSLALAVRDHRAAPQAARWP